MPIVIRKTVRPVEATPPQPVVEAVAKELKAPAPKPQLPEGYRLMDGEAKRVFENCGPDAMVPWWLIASYLYYMHDISIISDALFDHMSRDMLNQWDTITHDHKHLISEDDLQAGSGFAIPKYPDRVRYAAKHLVYTEWKVLIDTAVGS